MFGPFPPAMEVISAIRDALNETVLLILTGSLLLLVGHLLLFGRQRRVLKKDFRELKKKEEASKEVLQQHNLLQSRTKNIEDSLKYAQRIQEAVFTNGRELRQIFPASFIYQSPKDIVSGDFFWARKVEGKALFTTADCTGHGVPGAFMSIIGLEFFRRIVLEQKILKPNLVLEEMNRQFDLVFGTLDELSLKDGIDLAFCCYDFESRTLEYSGAFNPIYIVRNHEIIELKADRIIVGPDYGVGRKNFTLHSLQVEEGDIIYMFSDGYVDQFGGPEGKKFKYRRFRHLIMSIHGLAMDEQEEKLSGNMQDWMGGVHEQIDDQMVIGIRPAELS